MITLLCQLKARAAKIQSWMAKYSRVKSLIRKWALELTQIEGEIERLELAAITVSSSSSVPIQLSLFSMEAVGQGTPTPPPRKTQRYQVKTGSEWHSTERRGAMVTINGEAIYKVLKAQSQDWQDIGNKGKHGKWCIAEYEIPVGSRVEFRATGNKRDDIVASFIVGQDGSDDIDVDGYEYGNSICGWIVSL